MKAYTKKRATQKAVEAEFSKYAQEYADHMTHADVALFLCLLEKWGCKPETIRKRYQDIKNGYERTEHFGRKIHEADYIKQCLDRYGIDVTEIKTNITVEYA